jgi:hypothetical protein
MPNIEKKFNFLIPIVLVILGFGVRLLPHEPNFTPIGAIAIFAGLYLPKKISIIVPMIIMFLSDLVIGFYTWEIMAAVYICFGLSAAVGLILRNRKDWRFITGGTLVGSIIFYLVTNLAVWGFTGIYPHTVQGLIDCYALAIPFFRSTLAADLFYTGVLVGGVEVVYYFVNARSFEKVAEKL